MKTALFHRCFAFILSLCLPVTLAYAQADPPAEKVEPMPAQRIDALRPLLKDSAPGVRLRAAMTLAEANDAEAIPVLIDLLADLTPEQRRPVAEFLTQLAGEWAPGLQLQIEDEISRRIRRDAWAAWWRHTDGASLLAIVRKHTLTPQARARVLRLIAQLGDEQFTARENASKELFILGRILLPQLRDASKNADREIVRRAKRLIERIEQAPAHPLPIAALRLLAMRKPAGVVAALLAYLPYAEDETRIEELGKCLTALALRDGKPEPDLVCALADPQPLLRFTAGEALIKGGGAEGRSVVRKLLKDDAPEVRLRVALAFARAKQPEGVAVLIDLLTVLPAERLGEIEAALFQLAGDAAPEVSLGIEQAERKKCRDAWAAWWKVHAGRVDLARLTAQPWLGYTLICDANQVYEIDRHGKRRWIVENAGGPIDAWCLAGNRVLIAEWG